MASSTLVVGLLADASKFESEMKSAGAAADKFGSNLDSANGKAKGLSSGMEHVGGAIDSSESKFMGAADLLDGLATTMGFNIDGAISMARGFGDLAGGMTSVVVPAVKGVLSKLGLMTTATAAQTAATETSAVAQGGLNAALLANPIGAVILVIGALVAAGVLLYKNVDVVRETVDKCWQFMQTAWDSILNIFKGVFNWVKDNWPLLLGILTGPIGLAVVAITTHWDTIKNSFTAVKDWIGSRVGDIVGFFTGLPGRISTAVVGMFEGVKNAFRTAINWIIDKWNGFQIRIGGWTIEAPFPPHPKVTIPEFAAKMPQLPRLARGGITTGPTMAMIGDNPGGREAVIPLPRSGVPGGLGTTIVNLTVNGSVVTERQLIDVIHRGLLNKQSRGGNLGFEAA